MVSLADVNAMPADDFVNALGAIFEHSPWVARTVAPSRPFSSVQELHAAMVQAVGDAGPGPQLELIRAHPDLGAKLKMTDQSVSEQAGAGLDRLSPELFERFNRLNDAYKSRFGFPFIIAVGHHTRASILEQFERRLGNDADRERETALLEIAEIARFRLLDLLEA
jgi:2-oxo-4-hydroxy-4-carboxy-5-ureidoimidazoline decarboxylase